MFLVNVSLSISSSDLARNAPASQEREFRWIAGLAVFAVVIAGLVAPWLRHWLPTLIHMQFPTGGTNWEWDLKACLIAGAVSLPLVLWALAIRLEFSRRLLIPRWLPWLGAPSLVGLASFFSSHHKAQWYFLEAVKVRAEAYSYPRSMAFWQSEIQRFDAERKDDTKSQILFIGSSQMNFAVDAKQFAAARPDARIRKKTLPGFSASHYVLAERELDLRPNDLVVCWLSEFDFFREDELPANRLRTSSSLGSFPALLGSLGARCVANLEPLMDLFAASVLSAWRQRDLYRALSLNFWWRSNTRSEAVFQRPEESDIERQGQNLIHSVRRGTLLDANFDSFKKFATQLRAKKVGLLVVEGQTHPISAKLYDPEFREETRKRLRLMAERERFTYLDESVLPIFGSHDFADVYHLNSNACLRFTEFLKARVLNEH